MKREFEMCDFCFIHPDGADAYKKVATRTCCLCDHHLCNDSCAGGSDEAYVYHYLPIPQTNDKTICQECLQMLTAARDQAEAVRQAGIDRLISEYKALIQVSKPA
jgi:hypothetical protein